MGMKFFSNNTEEEFQMEHKYEEELTVYKKKHIELNKKVDVMKVAKKTIVSIEQAINLPDVLKQLADNQIKTLVLSRIKAVDSTSFIKTIMVKSAINCIVTLKNGQGVTGSEDGLLRLWNFSQGSCLNTFSKEDSIVVKGASKKNNRKNFKKRYLYYRGICCLVALPNGQVVSGLANGTIELWDFNKGTCLKAFKAHDAAVSCLAVLPNGQVFSGSIDGTLKLWNLEDESCVKELELWWDDPDHFDFFTSIAVLSNNQVACGSHRGVLVLWNWEKGTHQYLKGHGSDCICIALPNEQIVTTKNSSYWEGGILKLCDLKNKKWPTHVTFERHSSVITSIAVLSEGRIMSGSKDASIKLWDLKKGTCIKTFKGDSASINCLTVLSDEQIVGGTEDGTLKIWDLNTHLLTAREQADVLIAISDNHSLETLDLSGVTIHELQNGVKILQTILNNHPTLSEIHLDSIGLTEYQLQMLLMSIIHHQKITQLQIDDKVVLQGLLWRYQEQLLLLSARGGRQLGKVIKKHLTHFFKIDFVEWSTKGIACEWDEYGPARYETVLEVMWYWVREVSFLEKASAQKSLELSDKKRTVEATILLHHSGYKCLNEKDEVLKINIRQTKIKDNAKEWFETKDEWGYRNTSVREPILQQFARELNDYRQTGCINKTSMCTEDTLKRYQKQPIKTIKPLPFLWRSDLERIITLEEEVKVLKEIAANLEMSNKDLVKQIKIAQVNIMQIKADAVTANNENNNLKEMFGSFVKLFMEAPGIERDEKIKQKAAEILQTLFSASKEPPVENKAPIETKARTEEIFIRPLKEKKKIPEPKDTANETVTPKSVNQSEVIICHPSPFSEIKTSMASSSSKTDESKLELANQTKHNNM
jgi:WD40 repeat protein